MNGMDIMGKWGYKMLDVRRGGGDDDEGEVNAAQIGVDRLHWAWLDLVGLAGHCWRYGYTAGARDKGLFWIKTLLI